MASHDRPYSESQRERGFRDRNRSFGRRSEGFRRDDDDDDRGSWMSRERDEFERGMRDYRDRDPFDPRQDEMRRGRQSFEPDFDPARERQFGGERSRWEQFEDWERPRDFGSQREQGSRRGLGGSGGEWYGGGGYAGEPGRSGQRGDYSGSGFGYGGRQGSGAQRSSFSIGRSAWEQGGQQSRGRFGRFAGRGPKGYQRSDERLKEEICEQLTADPEIDAGEIEVLVQGGEVTLQGSVPERDMKRASEDLAEDVSGVQQVHNRLRVEPRQSDEGGRDPHAERSDSQGSEGQRSSAGRKAH